MSLRSMVYGYGGSGTAVLEGATEEILGRYDAVNGPIVSAMETAELLNEAFMEGFYAVNDLEIEAAMEGYQSVTESSGKMAAIKEKLAGAWKKLCELFRKMKEAVVGFFSNIATKIKEKALASDKFFNSLPGYVKVLDYEGPKFQNLDKIKEILSGCAPDAVFGRAKGYSKVIAGDKDESTSLEDFKDSLDKEVVKLKETYGIKGSMSTEDEHNALNAYFCPDDGNNKQQVNVSDVRKVVKYGAKISGEFAAASKKMADSYEAYAKKCEDLSKKAAGDDENAPGTEKWLALSAKVRDTHTFANKILSVWSSNYNRATKYWESAARSYMKKNGGDGENNGED